MELLLILSAMLSAVTTDPVEAMLTAQAPMNIPGQTRSPHKRIAASAIPLGGQTADALGWTCAKDKPKLPAQK
jgi:hypothetical protein